MITPNDCLLYSESLKDVLIYETVVIVLTIVFTIYFICALIKAIKDIKKNGK